MQHDEEIEVEEDTLSSALEEAWAAAEGDEPAVEEPEAEPEPLVAEAEETTEEVPVETEAVETEVDNEKAPVGLSLEAREAWKDVPDAVKSDIRKREADYEKGIVQYSQGAKRAEGMDKALQPYQQYLQMNGGAGQAIQGLLQTGSALQMGSPQQKAQVVANLIKQFGVDISSLDSMLVGEAPTQQSQQNNQFEQMLNERLGPMQQQLQGYQQREQEQQQQQTNVVAQEVNQFGTANEFYEDVKGEMADLLDMASNRGRTMTMDNAYKIACASHPQISGIIAARGSQEAVDNKRKAASSISGNAGGGIQNPVPNSMADALNAAWDTAGQM